MIEIELKTAVSVVNVATGIVENGVAVATVAIVGVKVVTGNEIVIDESDGTVAVEARNVVPVAIVNEDVLQQTEVAWIRVAVVVAVKHRVDRLNLLVMLLVFRQLD